MCQAKCVMCGGDVNDFTGRPDIFELPLGSNERRAVSVEGDWRARTTDTHHRSPVRPSCRVA